MKALSDWCSWVRNMLRPPARLRAMDLLPGALGAAWSGTPESSTVGKLNSELKVRKGRPWPTRQFIDVLNEAINRGILARSSGGSEFTSLITDSERGLRLPGGKIPDVFHHNRCYSAPTKKKRTTIFPPL
jgi:hypothetical protein